MLERIESAEKKTNRLLSSGPDWDDDDGKKMVYKNKEPLIQYKFTEQLCDALKEGTAMADKVNMRFFCFLPAPCFSALSLYPLPHHRITRVPSGWAHLCAQIPGNCFYFTFLVFYCVHAHIVPMAFQLAGTFDVSQILGKLFSFTRYFAVVVVVAIIAAANNLPKSAGSETNGRYLIHSKYCQANWS